MAWWHGLRKGGAQILAWTPGWLEWIISAGIDHVKVVDLNPDCIRALVAANPRVFITYRLVIDMLEQVQMLDGDPAKAGREFGYRVLRAIEPVRQYIKAVEGLNEVGLWDLADKYCIFVIEFGKVIQADGLLHFGFSWPTGNPPGYFTGSARQFPKEFMAGLEAYWAHYFPALPYMDAISTHEYGAPDADVGSPYLCGRWQLVRQILPKEFQKLPFVITEGIIDRGVIPGQNVGGYLNFMDDSRYASEIQWYLDKYCRHEDDSVAALHIFAECSQDPMWESFLVINSQPVALVLRGQREAVMGTDVIDPGNGGQVTPVVVDVTPTDMLKINPEGTKAWIAAGGPKSAVAIGIEEHLIRTGGLTITPEVCTFVKTQLDTWLDAYRVCQMAPHPVARDTILGADVSNYQPLDLSKLIAQYSLKHIFVRGWLKGEKPSPGITTAQVASARANGATAGLYFWAYGSSDPRDVIQQIALQVEQYQPSGIVPLDCETYKENGVLVDSGPDVYWLRAAFDEGKKLGLRLGIYTGKWYWDQYFAGVTEFAQAGIPLLLSQYRGGPTLDDVELFGGWTKEHIIGKQYSTENDVIDLDILDVRMCT